VFGYEADFELLLYNEIKGFYPQLYSTLYSTFYLHCGPHLFNVSPYLLVLLNLLNSFYFFGDCCLFYTLFVFYCWFSNDVKEEMMGMSANWRRALPFGEFEA
jgi:hypothetical protein